MTYGEAMRNARQRAGMTQKQLAQRSGICINTIANLENDYYCGNIKTIEALADVLEMTIDEYIGHEVKKVEKKDSTLRIYYGYQRS